MGTVLVGTCAWSDHTDFYPPGLKPTRQLEYYAQFFPVVEIDSTFYALQPARNFAGWARKTPENFVFDVKAYRVITRHDRSPMDKDELAYIVNRFASSLHPLEEAGKLRAVLLQFPPFFVCNPRNISYLLWCRERLASFTLAVEFRHRSWFEGDTRDQTLKLLADNRLVNVVCDEPQIGQGSVPMVAEVTYPKLVICRFHGRNAQMWYRKGLKTSGERFNYLYSDEELEELLGRVLPLSEKAEEMHILMNNNFGDYAVRNALRIREMLGQKPQINTDKH
ncbi:MAG TPA: DUF72 domain-containing protein [Syntrophothermus lipocalidus]|nr:DUF72 domain-containing protein [Syntrophothermus lipocalidus]